MFVHVSAERKEDRSLSSLWFDVFFSRTPAKDFTGPIGVFIISYAFAAHDSFRQRTQKDSLNTSR